MTHSSNFRNSFLSAILLLTTSLASPAKALNLKLNLSIKAPTQGLQVGDLIFQKSQSTQAKAIAEATGSEWSHVGILVKNSANQWYVAEAIQPLQATELNAWIQRGKNLEYKVMRHPQFNSSLIPGLYSELKKYQGKDYDIYFEWSDSRIYCSELTYKVLQKVLGKEVGALQRFRDLKLQGPYVQALIKKRYTDLGKPLNLDEEIVTPISQMQDPQLQLVRSSR